MQLRHEIKHLINYSDYLTLRNRLKHLASKDPFSDSNNQYLIRSVYFDNYRDTALKEKNLGVSNRDKFRIRMYNYDETFIKLEKKSKLNTMTQKIAAPIEKEQVLRLLNNDYSFLIESSEPLYRELYAKIKALQLRPKTIVDYKREAYVSRLGNVRITFDMDIRTGLSATNIFNYDCHTLEAIENKMIVLEVKYDEYIPDIFLDAIQLGNRSNCSVSKYELCRKFY